jgi:hypothetical protein
MKKINNVLIVLVLALTLHLYRENYKVDFATEWSDAILILSFFFYLFLLYLNNRRKNE